MVETVLMNSDELVKGRKAELSSLIRDLLEKQSFLVAPKLAAVLSGDNPQSAIYVEQKKKACEEVGIRSVVRDLRNKIEQGLEENITELNQDPDTNGIILQLPLRKGVNERKTIQYIKPAKDVDGLTEENGGKLIYGKADLIPCTPAGIIELLKYYNVPMRGSDVVIINRSNLVGKPLHHLFLNEDATVMMCHSQTKGLVQKTRQANIVVSAVGRKGFKLTPDMVNPESFVVLVGGYWDIDLKKTVYDADGVDYKSKSVGHWEGRCAGITSTTHCIGPMTVLKLMENTVKAAINQQKSAAL